MKMAMSAAEKLIIQRKTSKWLQALHLTYRKIRLVTISLPRVQQQRHVG
jgi:hypothetical protein